VLDFLIDLKAKDRHIFPIFLLTIYLIKRIYFLLKVHAIQKANTNFFCIENFFIRLSNQKEEFSWLQDFLKFYRF